MQNSIRERTIILASASPRRREILERLGLPVYPSPADIDESLDDDLPIAERVAALARRKAEAIDPPPERGRWILGADTLVALGGTALGKPQGLADAESMLQRLSGREHAVYTGLCLLDRDFGLARSAVSETLVRFSMMSDAEIASYLSCGEWRGAAGAYRIQDRAACFIERVEGSFSGIVGLPIREFYVILADSGYPFEWIPVREP